MGSRLPPCESSASPGAALDAAARRRGRRLAVASHPAGMTHRAVLTEELPTLALVGLGASEALVGLQRAFEPAGKLLQLLVLRFVGRVPKRRILLAGQVFAVVAGLPLVAYGALAAAPAGVGAHVALASFALASVGFVVAGTVWFPLLRAYVEPARTGQFFGLLRSGWHLTLIAYFLGARAWLAARPGAFGPLFGVAAAAGLVRILLVARLPEPRSGARQRIRARDAVALLRRSRPLRRYLAGMILFGSARRVATPFAIVMMRRTLGLGDADVAFATAALYAGGFASLYGWGRLVDRLGPLPVFRGAALGTALLLGAFALLGARASAGWMVAFFFALAVLVAGFGVADTQVLFGLAPDDEPTPTLVVADVTTSLAYGIAPLAAGVLLDAALAAGVPAIPAYRVLFLAAAVAVALAPLPVRRFGCAPGREPPPPARPA